MLPGGLDRAGDGVGRREGGEGELGILERAQWGWRAREWLERKVCGMCPVRFIWGGCRRLKERAVSAGGGEVRERVGCR